MLPSSRWMLRTMEETEQLRLMRMLSRVPDSRPLIAVLFEARAQSQLLDGVTLNLMRMVKKPGSSPPGQPQPQWHSSHILLCDATLDPLREKEPKFLSTQTIGKSIPTTDYHRSSRMLCTYRSSGTKRHLIRLFSSTASSTSSSSLSDRSMPLIMDLSGLEKSTVFPRTWRSGTLRSSCHRIGF
ncbi:hypothetical protein BS47DRAFT_426804 [Hydnum rufescens UP504]|uniref:Uncharacterized protein n=1 Tax=Hydnum rufescens UP504 TaxID=1448309 RepID=A0A9P6E174_9AGAM|nr:hypothetical protein BS47DRAFT_426804 [Hydnum rufescens UP504]